MASSYPQLVLFGDSLFQQSACTLDGFSFQAALQAHCIRRLDVVNRGFSGWTSKNAFDLLTQIFAEPTTKSSSSSPSSSTPESTPNPKIDYLLVLLGANDACRPLPSVKQHVPLAQFRKNLTAIVTHPYIAAHKPKVLLVTPPPVDEIRTEELDVANGHGETRRFALLSAEYSQAVREVAADLPGVVLIDLYKAIMDRAVEMTPRLRTLPPDTMLGTLQSGERGALKDLIPDGVHMSGASYRIFYDLVLPHIGAEWRDLPELDRTGWVFPDWRVLNPDT